MILFYVALIISKGFLSSAFTIFLFSIGISLIYFFIIKKHIIKSADFKLTSNKLEWSNKSVEFENGNSYKIHRMKGAGIKLNLKNGQTKRLSSNSTFCNSETFVELIHELDNILMKYNNGKIIRRDSLAETKFGTYLIIFFSFLIGVLLIHSLWTDKEMNLASWSLIITAWITLLSGFIIRK